MGDPIRKSIALKNIEESTEILKNLILIISKSNEAMPAATVFYGYFKSSNSSSVIRDGYKTALGIALEDPWANFTKEERQQLVDAYDKLSGG